MELSKYDPVKLSDKLTPLEKSIVLACNESRIKDLLRPVVEVKLAAIVCEARMRIGSKSISDKELASLQDLILKDMYISFPNVTMKEVEIAVYKGSMGEFVKKKDEVIYITPKNIHEWVKTYMTQVKREVIAKQRKFEEEQAAQPPSEEEKRRIRIGFINEYVIGPYNHLKASGEYIIQDPINVIYNILDDMGIVPLTPERKREIYAQAEVKYKEEASKFRDLAEAKEAKTLLKKIAEGSDDVNIQIKKLAKQMALEILLREMAEMEIDLEEVINERLKEQNTNNH